MEESFLLILYNNQYGSNKEVFRSIDMCNMSKYLCH